MLVQSRTWVREVIFLGLLLGSARCSPAYTEIEILLVGLPADTKHLLFERSPQGAANRSQFALHREEIRDRIRLRLTGDAGDSETVRVRALDDSFCRLASGDAQLVTGQATAEIPLADDRSLGCMLRVSSTGHGRVKVPECLFDSQTGSATIDYRLKNGYLDFPCAGGRQLQAEPDETDYFVGWSQACFGGGLCDPWSNASTAQNGPLTSLIADGLTEVHAAFAPRQTCTNSGFCWVNPAPHGFVLNGIWGSAPSDIWAVGERGTVMRYNGTGWSTLQAQDIGLDLALRGIWGSSRNDIWMVGEKGTILHWDGQAFRVSALGLTTALVAVWGSGPNEVFVAGDRGAAWRCNSRRDCEALPVASGTDLEGVTFLALWGRSATEVYFVGSRLIQYDGRLQSAVYEGIVMRWDGVSLSQIFTTRSVTTSSLRFGAITGRASGPRELWLGASNGSVFAGDGAHFHVDFETEAGSVNALTTTGPVLDSEAVDLWAATNRGQLLHHTGQGWEQVATPAFEALYGIYGDAVNLWAVGAAGVIVNWNGVQTVAATSGKRGLPLGRWLDSSGELWLSWDSRVITRTVGRTALGGDDINTLLLFGLRGFGDTLFASTIGGLWTRGPTGWSPLPSDSALGASTMLAIDGVSMDDLWSVGTKSSILHYTPAAVDALVLQPEVDRLIQMARDNGQPANSFDLATLGTAEEAVASAQRNALLNAVWTARADQIFAVGEAGLLVSTDGAIVDAQLMPFYGRLPTYYAVWGSSPTDGWIAGTSGAVLRYDGVSWKACADPDCPTKRPTEMIFLDIAGTGPRDVWLVGACTTPDCSAVYHWDGTQFCHVPGLPSFVRWVAAQGNDVFLVGSSGSILHMGDKERKDLKCIP